MQTWKRVHLLPILLLITLNFFFPISIAQQSPISFCGKIRIQKPFFLQNSTESSLLNRMVLCKSEKLYFRTSLGLFPISSIDYKSKLLTLSHSSCSSSTHFVSPSNLSAGLPPPPQPNSIIMFNCSIQTRTTSPSRRNCTPFHGCNASKFEEQEFEGTSSCLVVDDVGKMDKGFHPKDLNCSHYRRVYRSTWVNDDKIDDFELGTRISFDIPDHVPNPCDECEKPNGNCGIGLRCVCHPKQCKDKVFSTGGTLDPFGNIICSLLFFIAMVVLF
ncbi:unnamed protein product [Ilex paraguariensis]|uniref:Uncharacterized protein n=1 Tax=Ilex paraguariensis TaxID=185542 RepID=A0ABC8SA74_9AQUA